MIEIQRVFILLGVIALVILVVFAAYTDSMTLADGLAARQSSSQSE